MSVIKYKDSNGNYVKIPANVGINNVVEGYYNETDSKFYEESTYETEITGESSKIYISLDTDKSYYWDGSEYKLLSGGSGVTDFDDLTNRPLESDAIDIDDLDLPMPAKPTEYPVLFDEAGTEYQVGLYKRASDGKVKPLYQQSYTGTILSIEDKLFDKPTNADTIISIEGSVFLTTGNILALNNGEYGIYYKQALGYFTGYGSSISGYANGTYYVTIEYTKTTDEFRDL